LQRNRLEKIESVAKNCFGELMSEEIPGEPVQERLPAGGSNWIKVIGLVTCLDIFAIPKSQVVIAKIKGLREL
jgi:hypothetical protein